MVLTIATDCSGIEAPIEALKQMNLDFKHKWSCEIDDDALKTIQANTNPEVIYKNIYDRDNRKLPKNVNIYVCGFPCQSYSLLGKQLGTEDSRSNVLKECLKVIKFKTPDVFLLENVKNFKYIENGKPYLTLLDTVKKINNEMYSIYDDIYNTKDYGIPQNRERIYIIGIKKSKQKKEFIKPAPLKLKSLDNFILDTTKHDITNAPLTITRKIKESNSICSCDNFGKCMKGVCPTLTRSGCKYMFHTTYNRYLTVKECLLLQGFRKNFINIVGDSKLCNQIGNSMSVNVLKSIFKAIIRTDVFRNIKIKI